MAVSLGQSTSYTLQACVRLYAEPTWIPSNKGRLGKLGSYAGLMRAHALGMKASLAAPASRVCRLHLGSPSLVVRGSADFPSVELQPSSRFKGQLTRCPLTMGSVEEQWEIVWCLDAWHIVYEALKRKLPPWCTLRMVNASKPLHEQVTNADVLIPTTGKVDGQVIRSAPKLKLIVQSATGYSNIDIETAGQLGIPVCNSPGVNAASVAEATLMTLLMLARRAKEQMAVFEQKGLGEPFGIQLAGKRLGIVGMGNIGRRLARAAEAMDMEVTPITSASTRTEIEAMLQSCSFVSLHCPLTPKTRGLIGRAELAIMPKGSMIINYARGEVIDKEALVEALHSGHIGGAGLDAHHEEPADPSEPLYQHPNVIATPHTGVSTLDVVEMYSELLRDNIVRRREGRELLHRLL